MQTESDPEKVTAIGPMQHDSADGCQGVADISWTGKLSWKVYPSPSYSIGATQRFVQDERSIQLETTT